MKLLFKLTVNKEITPEPNSNMSLLHYYSCSQGHSLVMKSALLPLSKLSRSEAYYRLSAPNAEETMHAFTRAYLCSINYRLPQARFGSPENWVTAL